MPADFHAAWRNWVHMVEAECIARGRSFGIVNLDALRAAFEERWTVAGFVDRMIERDASFTADPTFAERLEADAKEGFTRD